MFYLYQECFIHTVINAIAGIWLNLAISMCLILSKRKITSKSSKPIYHLILGTGHLSWFMSSISSIIILSFYSDSTEEKHVTQWKQHYTRFTLFTCETFTWVWGRHRNVPSSQSAVPLVYLGAADSGCCRSTNSWSVCSPVWLEHKIRISISEWRNNLISFYKQLFSTRHQITLYNVGIWVLKVFICLGRHPHAQGGYHETELLI